MTTGPMPTPPPWPDPAAPPLRDPGFGGDDDGPEPFGLSGVLTVVGVCLALGILLALAWWLLAPAARETSVPAEAGVASDGALVVLSLVLGLAHGISVVIRGGALAVSRVLATFLAACVGAAIATLVGLLLGATEHLAVIGAALMWPVAFLVVVGFAEALRYALSRED